MAEATARQVPTQWLLIICATLIAALFVDFNTEDANTSGAIYPAKNANRLVLAADTQQLEFQHIANQWQLVAPLAAPANPQVIEHLLSSNLRSARSYALGDIAQIDGQRTVARLMIDENLFEFKSIEPVSGLRYVVAADRIYLQSDRVVPLIQADPQMAMNRKIAISCGTAATPCTPVTLEASHLVQHDTRQVASGEIDLQLANGKIESYSLYNANGRVALHRPGTTFRYVLDPATTTQLGLPPPKT